jgi:hypothetical protein
VFAAPRLPASLKDAKLRVPVRQRQAQPLDIGIAREQLGFDSRDLAAAPLDFHSRRYSRAL